MPDFPVFSPSQTLTFLRCPVEWKFSREKLVPKTWAKMELYALRGTLVSEGLCVQWVDRNSPNLDQLIQLKMSECYDIDVERNRLKERTWDDARFTPPSKSELIEECLWIVKQYKENNNLPFEQIAAEQTFPQHGWARLDLIAKDSRGLLPLDYKVKDETSSLYLANKIRQDYATSWQLQHYAWMVGDTYENANCNRFGVIILWVGARVEVDVQLFTFPEERKDRWLKSAKLIWQRMDNIREGREDPHEAGEHSNQFGSCMYHSLCFSKGGNPMDNFLVRNS